MTLHTHVAMNQNINRRNLLKRSVQIGAVIAGSAGLLAGCWPFSDDDDDEEEEIESTPDTPAETPEPEPTPVVLSTPEPTSTPEPSPTPEPTPVDPQDGGRIIVALPADPWSLHPNADEAIANWAVIAQIYDPLIEVDHEFELVPILAETYEFSDDGTEIVFDIRDDVLFHNGAELTPEDVRYTHEWLRNPENAPSRSFYYERVEEITTDDARSVVFRMAQPDGTILRRAASAYIVNAEYHETVGPEGQSLNPIGTGPYLLDDWARGTRVLLSVFEDYHRGRSYVDTLDYRVISDASARASSYRNGDVDIVFNLDIDAAAEIDEEGPGATISVVGLDCNHIALNTQRPILDERDVRLAMLYAIDRRGLVRDVFADHAVPATSCYSPAVDYWHSAVIEEDSRLVDRANELLDVAGWIRGEDGIRERDGTRLAFTCHIPDSPDPRNQEGVLIRDMLAEVGIDMQVQSGPVGDHVAQMRDGSLDAALFNWTFAGWRGEPDARTTLQTGAFNNFSQYQNAQLDFALAEGVSRVVDEARREVYVRVQDILGDRVPFLFLLFPFEFYHFGPNVHGVVDEAAWGSRLLRLVRDFWSSRQT